MVAELFVASGSEEEQLQTALYRFLELRGRAHTAEAFHIVSDGPAARRRKLVALWSEEATVDFKAYWHDYRRRVAAQHPLFQGTSVPAA